MTEITIKTLSGVAIEEVADSWNKAFGDYKVSVGMSAEMLGSYFRQTGVKFELSIGAYDDNLLVGFWMNGVRSVNGVSTAYDSGTAIWPEYRNRGISKSLSEMSDDVLRKSGIREYQLEVISDNKRAFGIYQKNGFVVTRELICLRTKMPLKYISGKRDVGGVSFGNEPFHDSIFSKLPRMEYLPSWQNSLDAVCAIKENIQIITAKREGKIIAYAMIQNDRSRIPQIGIDGRYWKTNIPSLLLHELCKGMKRDSELVITNVDSKAKNTLAMFEDNGFEIHVTQYEMKKALKSGANA